ncbi:MAG: T9SS type A sorting domain-containing protein [Ginsengibacter sp.]
MKNLNLSFLLLSFFLFWCVTSQAQVNLPYSLTFSSDDPTDWTDGIAQDGEGGTSKINGLSLLIYTAAADHTTLYPGSTIVWHNNTYYASSTSSYTGITSGPDVTATINGVPAMVIKSSDNSVNFSLKSIQLYDWGFANVITIETYDNGVIKGSVDFTPDPDFAPLTVSQADLLTVAFFDNIDEIRFFPKAPITIFNLSMNDISLEAASGPLPVTFSNISARQQNKDILVEWKVENQSGIQKYDLERSAGGRAFTIIATQKAIADHGAATTYHWLDQNLLPGNNFYRIKSTDITGREAYSPVIKMYSGNSKPALLIYPNPATAGIVHLQMNNMPGGTYHINLVNSAGQVMLTKATIHETGSSYETLNFSSLTKGVYILEVVHPDRSKSKSTIVY